MGPFVAIQERDACTGAPFVLAGAVLAPDELPAALPPELAAALPPELAGGPEPVESEVLLGCDPAALPIGIDPPRAGAAGAEGAGVADPDGAGAGEGTAIVDPGCGRAGAAGGLGRIVFGTEVVGAGRSFGTVTVGVRTVGVLMVTVGTVGTVGTVATGDETARACPARRPPAPRPIRTAAALISA